MTLFEGGRGDLVVIARYKAMHRYVCICVLSFCPSFCPSFSSPFRPPSFLFSFLPSCLLPSLLPSFLHYLPSFNPSCLPSNLLSFRPSNLPSFRPSNLGAIVGKHGCKGPTHDLTAVDDRGHLAVHAFSNDQVLRGNAVRKTQQSTGNSQ